jgi:ubiquinone/menaquinone biosynthesis C-methylase UbiE
MAHKFDPSMLEKLEDPSRLEIFNPEAVLNKFGLKEGMVVLDVGTGTGFYLPYLSKLVGEKGKVYAVDIEPKLLDYAKKRVEDLRLRNVEVLKSEENSIPLPESSIDFIFMAFVFHELKEPLKYFEEIKRVAKVDATLLIIDWTKIDRDKGPPPSEVYSEDEVKNYLRRAGIEVKSIEMFNKYAYGIAGKINKNKINKN